MTTKNQMRELFFAKVKKWLFPDFTNKLTWMVSLVGCAILIEPGPLSLVIYNWLVDTINLNSGTHYTLAEIKSVNTEKILGLSLVAGAFLHNLANKYLSSRNSIPTNSDIISNDDWPIVKERILSNLKSDSEKLEKLIPLLRDGSHPKTVDSENEIDSSIEPLLDRLHHLTSNARSKIENEKEINLIRKWLNYRKEVNRELNSTSRVNYANKKASLLKASISSLIQFYVSQRS